MRTEEVKVYKYEELSESAQEKAREWYREGNLDYDWWDCVYEDAERIGNLMGIEFDQKPIKLMNGSFRYEPKIYFSGFWSQGDGACFEGSYSYKKGSVKAVKDYAPMDKELHRIAEQLRDIQRKNFYQLTATVTHRGMYSHSRSTTIDVGRFKDYDEVEMTSDAEETVSELLRDFMDWIYEQLEKEFDWLNSDEAVEESIITNEYDFLEDGSRW